MGFWERRSQGSCLTMELVRATEAPSWMAVLDELADNLLHERGRARGIVLLLSRADWLPLRPAELAGCNGSSGLEDFARRVQEVLALLAGSPLPVAAVVSGSASGLGAALAVACHRIFFAHDDEPVLRFPEIRSALVAPGGTLVRLARVMGSVRAAEVMALAEPIRASEAVILGMASRATEGIAPLDAACSWIQAKPGFLDDFLRLGKVVALADEAAPLRRLRLKLVERRTGEALGVGFRAPFVVLEALATLADLDSKQALDAERRLFVELASSREFHAVCRLQTAVRTAAPQAQPTARRGFELASARQKARTASGEGAEVLVQDLFLGRGFAALSGEPSLATATAILLASRGVKVRLLCDESEEREALSLQLSRALSWSERRSGTDKAIIEGRISVCDMAFIPEDIVWIACGKAPEMEGPALRALVNHREGSRAFLDVALFPPFDDRSVAEVVAGAQARLFTQLFRGCGHWVLEARDDFLTAGIFAAWFDEARRLVDEGASIDEVDGALEEFGFRRGPFALIDEHGFEFWRFLLLGGKHPLHAHLHEFLSRLVEDGWLGREADRGFYRYEGASRRSSDPDAYRFFVEPLPGAGLRNRDIVERCFLRMLGHAVELVFASSDEEEMRQRILDADVVSTLVLGFPPWRGGPFFHAQTQGIEQLAERFRILERRYGERFALHRSWSRVGDLIK